MRKTKPEFDKNTFCTLRATPPYLPPPPSQASKAIKFFCLPQGVLAVHTEPRCSMGKALGLCRPEIKRMILIFHSVKHSAS